MSKTRTFTVTAEHLKLLRHFQVGWQDCETGAPEIDPKQIALATGKFKAGKYAYPEYGTDWREV